MGKIEEAVFGILRFHDNLFAKFFEFRLAVGRQSSEERVLAEDVKSFLSHKIFAIFHYFLTLFLIFILQKVYG